MAHRPICASLFLRKAISSRATPSIPLPRPDKLHFLPDLLRFQGPISFVGGVLFPFIFLRKSSPPHQDSFSVVGSWLGDFQQVSLCLPLPRTWPLKAQALWNAASPVAAAWHVADASAGLGEAGDALCCPLEERLSFSRKALKGFSQFLPIKNEGPWQVAVRQATRPKYLPYRKTGVAIPLSHYVSCGIAGYRCYTPTSLHKNGLSQSKDGLNRAGIAEKACLWCLSRYRGRRMK